MDGDIEGEKVELKTLLGRKPGLGAVGLAAWRPPELEEAAEGNSCHVNAIAASSVFGLSDSVEAVQERRGAGMHVPSPNLTTRKVEKHVMHVDRDIGIDDGQGAQLLCQW